MKKLKAIYATLLMGVGLAIIIFFIFITRKKNNAFTARRFCRIWFPLCGFKLEKIGEFDTSATLIIINHQSLTDICLLYTSDAADDCWSV